MASGNSIICLDVIVRNIAGFALAFDCLWTSMILRRLQPLSNIAWTFWVQFVAAAFEFNQWRPTKSFRCIIIFDARLIQVFDNSWASTHSIVRNSIESNFDCKIKDNYLFRSAWTLRSNSIASLFVREIEKVFLAWILNAHCWFRDDLAIATGPFRVKTVTQTVVHYHVAIFTLAWCMIIIPIYFKLVPMVRTWSGGSNLVTLIGLVVIMR